VSDSDFLSLSIGDNLEHPQWVDKEIEEKGGEKRG
jgi:hypothetical protein